MRVSIRAVAMCAALVAMSGSAMAADPIKLRVADSFPKGHFLIKLLLEPWMDGVRKRTNDAVVFEHYPAQQLGKAADMLRLTQTGVADIGYIGPAYAAEKMPVSEVAMLPGAFDHTCQGTLAYWKAARSGVIAEQDYDKNAIRLLLAVARHLDDARPVAHVQKDQRAVITAAMNPACQRDRLFDMFEAQVAAVD